MKLDSQTFYNKFKTTKPKNPQRIIVYCRRGVRAEQATNFLLNLGYEKYSFLFPRHSFSILFVAIPIEYFITVWKTTRDLIRIGAKERIYQLHETINGTKLINELFFHCTMYIISRTMHKYLKTLIKMMFDLDFECVLCTYEKFIGSGRIYSQRKRFINQIFCPIVFSII